MDGEELPLELTEGIRKADKRDATAVCIGGFGASDVARNSKLRYAKWN
jgi:hypothetical protein